MKRQTYFLKIAPINDHKRKTFENKVVSLAKWKEVYSIDKNDDDLNNGIIWSKDDGLNNGNDLKETGQDICDEVLLVIIKSKWDWVWN